MKKNLKYKELEGLLEESKNMIYFGFEDIDVYKNCLKKGLTKYDSVCILDMAKSEIDTSKLVCA